MLLFPKKPKFLKSFSGKKGSRITNSKILNLRFGNVAIIANENGKITNFQLEALRRFLKKVFKKKAQLFFRFFPQLAITKKPNDIRQGRGKGNVKY
jgi:large subunit ribosomal protein L16